AGDVGAGARDQDRASAGDIGAAAAHAGEARRGGVAIAAAHARGGPPCGVHVPARDRRVAARRRVGGAQNGGVLARRGVVVAREELAVPGPGVALAEDQVVRAGLYAAGGVLVVAEQEVPLTVDRAVGCPRSRHD